MSIHTRQTAKGVRYDVRIRDDGGKVHNRTFRTRKEAERHERAELTARDRGTWIDPSSRARTFADLAAEWLAANPGKRATSYSRDEIALRLHITPQLGERSMGSITPADVQKLVNSWSTSMAPRSVKRTYGVLRAVTNLAVERDVIARTPCRGIKLPAAPPVRRTLPDPDALVRLADAMGDLGGMVWIGAALGLRWGEVAGLRVGRLDFLRGTIEVAEQVTRGPGGKAMIGEPKSDAGRRTIAAPRALMALLTDQLARRGLTGADPDAFVFVAPAGGMLEYSHWRRRVWQPACVAAGLEGLGFHDLRRVNATALLAEGVDVRTAQARLGHSDPRLTLQVYAQATSVADREAADRLGERLMPEVTRDGRAMGSGAPDGGEASLPA